MRKVILFRADGNSLTGLGHIYRLFSLVEIVKNTYDFIFLTKESSIQDIIPKSYPKQIIPEEIAIEYEPEWLKIKYSPEKHIIIADGYQFNSLYQKQIKENGYGLIYVDDLAKEHMFADIVINHSPFVNKNHFLKEAYTTLALGPKYALLRPIFLEQAKKTRVIQKIDSSFVCFGGSDPFNLTTKAVKALLKIETIKNIHVVLGSAYKHEDIFELEKRAFGKIKTYRNLSEEELVKVMLKCNFAIAPASTILYELCCIKMPVLCGFYMNNQELIYKGFLNNNAIYEGGFLKNVNMSGFVIKVKNVIEENTFKLKIEAQKALFDDKITARHLNLVKQLC